MSMFDYTIADNKVVLDNWEGPIGALVVVDECYIAFKPHVDCPPLARADLSRLHDVVQAVNRETSVDADNTEMVLAFIKSLKRN